MRVLQISAHFLPNLGGIETHLSDLTQALVKRNWQVFVLTYIPLTTKAKWTIYENNNNLIVMRIPWISGFFYTFVRSPILEFLYLVPGLFFITPFIILIFNPKVINGHGLVAGFVSVFWGRLFGKRVVISTHSIYHFPLKGLYRTVVKWIFLHADFVLGLSEQAANEIRLLGIPQNKVSNFTYWVDLDKFKAKRNLGRGKKFTVIFVGRLVEEKGINELLESVKGWNNNMILRIIGSGPLEEEVKKAASKHKNVEFIGIIDQDQLPLYYSGSDILIVPSVSEEGFGRVILEALACGLPVIGANRGAIPEAMDESVGKLIEISPKNIKNAVDYFFKNPDALKKLKGNCREFAERRYSEKNVEKIIRAYLE